MKYIEFFRNRIPKEIKHLLLDIDGTITSRDIPNNILIDKIAEAARLGVEISFVTGRDAGWLKRILLPALKSVKDYPLLLSKLHFFPELGLVRLDPLSEKESINPLVENHPLLENSIREKLSGLFYNSQNTLDQKEEQGYFSGMDADGKSLLFSRNEPKIPWLVWSESKTVMASAEVIRNRDGSLMFPEKVNQATTLAKEEIKRLGLERQISLSPVSTALNIVPIVENRPLDKDVGARIAIQAIANKNQKSFLEVAKETFAIGDGKADLLFAVPPKALVSVGFVGPESQYQPTPMEREGVAIRTKKVGPEGTIEVLRAIWPRMRPKTFFRNAEKGRQTNPNPTVLNRIKHVLGNFNLHLAELAPATQQEHSHSSKEAIMLLSGEIEVFIGQKQMAKLAKEGDIIVFPSNQDHFLVVKKISKVVVISGFEESSSNTRRIADQSGLLK